LLFDFALEYAIRRVYENQKLNGIHELLAYAYDSIVGETIPYRKTEALLDWSGSEPRENEVYINVTLSEGRKKRIG
jgi:hypothetical protein